MLYAVLVGAPMNHFMISWLQRIFFGQTSLLSKVLQILVNNLLVCLLQIMQRGSGPEADTSVDRTHTNHCVFERDGTHRRGS